MNPQSSSTANLPELMKETDVKLIVDFATKQGAKPNEQMIAISIQSELIDVRVAKLNGVILGMKVHYRLINPLRGLMAYSVLEDWSNGFVGLDPI